MNQTKQLNRENNRLDEQLDGEYESVMTDLVCYLRGADITDGQAERVRRDLLEMFIAAKERGEDVQTLIGGDYRQFCDAILENVPRRTVRQRVVNGLSIALTCAGVLGLSKTLMAGRKILCKRFSTKVKNGAGKQGGFWPEFLVFRKPWRSERYARRHGVNTGLAAVAY